MPLGLHLPELIIVLAVALLIFGPKKLPDGETKLPASTTNEMGKLNTTAVETDAAVKTTTVNSEVTSSEVKVD